MVYLQSPHKFELVQLLDWVFYEKVFNKSYVYLSLLISLNIQSNNRTNLQTLKMRIPRILERCLFEVFEFHGWISL